jgi:hypothetical protein
MKRTTQTLLGVSAFLSVPETIEEFNSLAGGDKALEYANAEAYYRGVAPKVRSAFLANIEKALGHAPRVVSTKTVGVGEKAKEVPVFEKDTTFIKHIKATEGVTDEQINPLLQSAFDDVGWDLSSTRSSGPNKKDIEAAEFYLAAIAAGKSTFDRVIANFENANPGLVVSREADGSVSKDVMAEIVKTNRLRIEAEAAGASMLG